jgi:hypothetical protein
MNTLTWLWKSVLAWAVLAVASIIAAAMVPVKAPSVPHQFAWWLLSNFLAVAAVTFAAIRSDWRGLRLGFLAAAVPLFVSLADMLEGAVFLGHLGIDWKRLAVNSVISYGLSAPAWGVIYSIGKEKAQPGFHPFASQPVGDRVWKYALSAFSYLFLYYLAGTLVFPFIRDFYATQTVPAARTIVMLQLLVRGPVFVALCLLLLRMAGFARMKGALAVGLMFTIISGVAPLLMPNPFFPDAIRWAHFCEVTSSNFLFGAFVGWLWGERKPVGALTMGQAA